MMAKELGVPFVLAKATGLRQKKILESVGADRVIMPEIEMGLKVAQYLMTADPMEYIHLSVHYEILEMSPKKEWIGKSLAVLNLSKNNNLNILTIIREGAVLPSLSADTIILAGDKMIALHTVE